MARRKNYFSFLDFNYVDGAFDLFLNTMRNSFEYDAYTDDVFQAVALTEPTPIVEDVGTLAGQVGLSFEEGINQKFSFRARILGNNSPHRFLPDPCSLEYASTDPTADQIFSLIQNHIQVIIYDEASTKRPKQGDVVNIKLERSGNAYNLQRAKQYIGIATEADSAAATASRPDCDSLGALFKKGRLTNMGASGASYIEHFDPSIGPLANPIGPSGTPPRQNDWIRASGRLHGGNDYGVSIGSPLYATHDGVVIWQTTVCKDQNDNLKQDPVTKILSSDRNKDCGEQLDGTMINQGGNSLIVKHADGWYTFYGHLSPPTGAKADKNNIPPFYNDVPPWPVKNGTTVKAGTLIAYSGNTGRVKGAHLHLELKDKTGKRLNPEWHVGDYHAVSKAEQDKEKASLLAASGAPAPTTTGAH